jgi:hypothetical protein
MSRWDTRKYTKILDLAHMHEYDRALMELKRLRDLNKNSPGTYNEEIADQMKNIHVAGQTAGIPKNIIVGDIKLALTSGKYRDMFETEHMSVQENTSLIEKEMDLIAEILMYLQSFAEDFKKYPYLEEKYTDKLNKFTEMHHRKNYQESPTPEDIYRAKIALKELKKIKYEFLQDIQDYRKKKSAKTKVSRKPVKKIVRKVVKKCKCKK